jgi:hypothetical protein
MTYEKNPTPEELARRQKWFERYVRELASNSVVSGAQFGARFACPCCRFLTLRERGGYEICPVCFWEDDGQDDHDAARVRGGPNGILSLAQARLNFGIFGACEERHRKNVRLPKRAERAGE